MPPRRPALRRLATRAAAVALAGALAGAVTPPAAQAAAPQVTRPTAYVDPLIGTANGGEHRSRAPSSRTA
ncbi:hypothetical protein GA0115239_107730 [Streptomyces sp. BpilaLS-43]|nr:hypothetical protein GA0115239_107730 [Streptomyces sp. BpilaLS-43]